MEGATVTTYYMDEAGNAVKWNAEEFAQINPVVSDRDGNYGWFVPAGQWKVVAEKGGYTTADSTAEKGWLDVPPPQLDVNLELVSDMQPKVAGVDLASDKMLVRFDNYVLADSVSANSVVLKDSKDAAVEIASVEAVDAKTRNDDSIAKEFMVTFKAPVAIRARCFFLLEKFSDHVQKAVSCTLLLMTVVVKVPCIPSRPPKHDPLLTCCPRREDL